MAITARSTISDLGPEYNLTWPSDIFISEARAILDQEKESSLSDMGTYLLLEAFEDDVVSREFSEVPISQSWVTASWDTGPTSMTAKEHLQFLMKQARTLHNRPQRAPYWLDRKGIVVSTGPESQGSLQADWVALVRELITSGYVSKIAPKPCVDDDDYDDLVPVKEKLDSIVESRINVHGLWQRSLDEPLDSDYLYALIEVFHDLVSRPRTRSFHSYGNCGWHFSNQGKLTGQRIYQWRTNALLEKHRTGLHLADSGENYGRLIQTINDPRAEIGRTAIAKAEPETQGGIEHAIALFELRAATREDKRSACVALARVLEKRRKLIKKEMLGADEGLLFELANKFDLRHQRADQHSDYAVEFLDWVFWVYLATIELTNRLIAHQKQVAKSGAEAFTELS